MSIFNIDFDSPQGKNIIKGIYILGGIGLLVGIFTPKNHQNTITQTANTREQEVANMKGYDDLVLQKFAEGIDKAQQEGGTRLIDRFYYRRNYVNFITWVYELTPDAPDVEIPTAIKTWCASIASCYQGQTVYVEAKRNGITIAKSEYSPYTNTVK